MAENLVPGLPPAPKTLEELPGWANQVGQILNGLSLAGASAEPLTTAGGDVAGVLRAMELQAGWLQLTKNPDTLPNINTLYPANIPKAWILFNMATDAIADSFNVSSITDGAAGLDTVNWDRDFASANYTATGNIQGNSGKYGLYPQTYAAGSLDVLCAIPGSSQADDAQVSLIAFGDQ